MLVIPKSQSVFVVVVVVAVHFPLARQHFTWLNSVSFFNNPRFSISSLNVELHLISAKRHSKIFLLLSTVGHLLLLPIVFKLQF